MPMRAVAIAGVLVLALFGAGCNRSESGISTGDLPLNSSAGSLVVRCIDTSQAKLISWQPKPGFTAKVIVQGPSAEASILFSSKAANDVTVAVRCIDAQPQLREFVNEDTTTSIGILATT